MEDFFSRLDDTRFNLIAVGQSADAELERSLGPLVRMHAIPARLNETPLKRAQLPATCFYLLRPDGHVALAGTRLDPSAITRYLDELRIGGALTDRGPSSS